MNANLKKKKKKRKWYPEKTMLQVDELDKLAFLVNTPTQAESVICSLEQPAESIGLYIKTSKTVHAF